MATIAERNSEAINPRMAPCIDELLRIVAEREHRTLSNMLATLILEHAAKLGVSPAAPKRGKGTKRTKPLALGSALVIF